MERALDDGHVRSRGGGRRGAAVSLGRPDNVEVVRPGLAAFDRPAPSLARYDDLLGVG